MTGYHRPQRFSRVVSQATAPYLNLDAGAPGGCAPNPVNFAPRPGYSRSHQMFGLWQPYVGTGAAFPSQGTPPLTSEESMLSPASEGEEPVWWTVDLWALEVTRFVPLGGSVPALTRGEVNSQGRRFSRLKARVSYEKVLSHSMDIDVGTGVRFSVLANSVRVSVLTPPTFRLSGDKMIGPQLGPGTVLDTIIAASCYESDSPVGEKSATFSQYVIRVSSNAVEQDIPVPPAAKYVTVYPSPPDPGNVPLEWMQIGAAGALLLPAGTIDFPASTRRVDKIAVPQGVDTLRIPAGAALAPRGWNIIWHLEI